MKPYLVYFTACFALLVTGVSSSAVTVAFPVITSDLQTNLVLAGWILSIGQLVTIITMPLGGKFADTYGRKFTFQVCMVTFVVGSALCAVAPNIYWLIGARFIQSIALGALLPLVTAIAADEFPLSRMRAIGFVSSVFPVGAIIGPNIGGWLVTAYGWRSIFWINVPLGALAFIAAWLLLRSGEKAEAQLDVVGAGLLGGSLSALMLGISGIGNSKITESRLVLAGLVVAGLILMLFFLRRESRVKSPIIDLAIIRNKAFVVVNLFQFVLGVAVFGVLSFVPLYAVTVYGMSTQESGFVLTARSVGMMLGTTITSTFMHTWGYRLPILLGTFGAILSIVLLGLEISGLSVLGLTLGSISWLMIVLGVSGLSTGSLTPASNNAALELMPDRVATITGTRGMFRQIGGVVGITLTTVLLSNAGDMSHGFTIVLFGVAGVMLLSVPLIMMMPSGRKAG